jgi:hypothetical protein
MDNRQSRVLFRRVFRKNTTRPQGGVEIFAKTRKAPTLRDRRTRDYLCPLKTGLGNVRVKKHECFINVTVSLSAYDTTGLQTINHTKDAVCVSGAPAGWKCKNPGIFELHPGFLQNFH